MSRSAGAHVARHVGKLFCTFPAWEVPAQIPKLTRAFEQPLLPALLLFQRRRCVRLLIDDLPSEVGCPARRATKCCFVINSSFAPNKLRSIACRKSLFESFINAPLAVFYGAEFLLLVHRN
jgi:hypothetical protein